MSPDERTEAESKADRALRRGELSTALTLFQAIATAFPTDEGVAQKLKTIRANLQPMELTSAKTRVAIDQSPPPTNSIQSAEALAAAGQYAEAIALYRKALEKRPDSPLIRERLAELFQIVQAMAPRATPSGATPAAAPRAAQPLTGSVAQPLTGSVAQPLTGSPAQPLTGSPAQRLTGSPAQRLSGSAAQPPPRPLDGQAPVSTARLLSDLLDQISRRRRSPPFGA